MWYHSVGNLCNLSSVSLGSAPIRSSEYRGWILTGTGLCNFLRLGLPVYGQIGDSKLFEPKTGRVETQDTNNFPTVALVNYNSLQ